MGIHMYIQEGAAGTVQYESVQYDVPRDVLVAQVEKAGAEPRLVFGPSSLTMITDTIPFIQAEKDSSVDRPDYKNPLPYVAEFGRLGAPGRPPCYHW
jgi:hypothetical protein